MFKREWLKCVIPGRDDAWQLIQLQNKTHSSCYLSNVDTIEDAWSKYAFPAILGSNLIKGFIELKLSTKNDAREWWSSRMY
jgi:hypothetical protein